MPNVIARSVLATEGSQNATKQSLALSEEIASSESLRFAP